MDYLFCSNQLDMHIVILNVLTEFQNLSKLFQFEKFSKLLLCVMLRLIGKIVNLVNNQKISPVFQMPSRSFQLHSMRQYFANCILFFYFRDKVMKHGVCIRVIGDLSLLDDELRNLIAQIMLMTKNNKRAHLNIAFAYTCKYIFDGLTSLECLLELLTMYLFAKKISGNESLKIVVKILLTYMLRIMYG